MSVQGVKPLRVLILLNRMPYPLNDGGAIGAYNFVKGYAEAGCDLTILGMNTAKHFVKKEVVVKEFSRFGKLKTVYVDNRIKPLQAFLNLFTNESYIIKRFISMDFKKQLWKLLVDNEYDIVHIDGLPPAAYINTVRKYSRAKISMRAHNVEHVIWERIAFKELNSIKKKYVALQAERLKQFEIEAIKKCDVVMAISKEDEETIKKHVTTANTVIVPAGMDVNDNIENENYNANDLFFIGSFDWMPNLQGMQWFINECWGRVSSAFSTAKLYVAGKKMPDSLKKLQQPNLVPLGEVRDAKEFMLQHGIMVVPIISGSGIRIKILEGMALGKCIIATPIAAEGLNLIDGENILIADNAEQFVAQLSKCRADENFSRRIGERAHKFAYDNYRNKSIFERLVSYYRTLL